MKRYISSPFINIKVAENYFMTGTPLYSSKNHEMVLFGVQFRVPRSEGVESLKTRFELK